LSIAQIHQITGDSDQNKATQVTYELMGAVLIKEQTQEMHYELRKDSEIGQRLLFYETI
jgi:hypothetical protein